jgi:large subunit ribosomal protein L17
MLRNMVTSLFSAERITTTDAKAKEARRLAERLITRAKKGFTAHRDGEKGVALAHWRQAARVVQDTDVLRKLFEEIAPHYMERNGGYTRIIRLPQTRVGDNARLVLLELVDSEASKSPLVRGAKPETAGAEGEEKKPAKGRGKPKEEAAAEAKPKKEKKAKEEKPAKTKAAKPGKEKADTKKAGGAGRKSRPKKSGE